MKNNINYENAPEEVRESLRNAKRIEDFLPPPDQLFIKDETKKITISLSQKSIDFFKKASKENHVPYQQMIRKVLDNYTDHYAN